MSSYYRRMISVIQSNGEAAAYDLAKRDEAKRKAARKKAKAARKRNR